jgi:AcrR family transcriptional regulator
LIPAGAFRIAWPMPPQSNVQVKYNTPLRQAQRDLTRSRIKNAARELFYEHHYDATTMDEIAAAAGLRRSTLYLHYKDKAEILADIIAEYTPKHRAILARIPGPQPTLKQLQRWVRDVANFVARERIPLSIILEIRHNKASVQALEKLTSELLEGLGEKSPKFKEAARANAGQILRARAVILLQQLTYACQVNLDDQGGARGKAFLAVTAEDFAAFLSTP